MNKYMEWLKGQIKNANESAEKYAKEKEFGTAYMYLAKVTAFEECLAEFERSKKEPEQGVSFDGLEVGKKYVGVHFTGGKINAFVVIAKGRDSEGQYIWYGDTMNDTVALKSYVNEYETIEYFKEVE